MAGLPDCFSKLKQYLAVSAVPDNPLNILMKGTNNVAGKMSPKKTHKITRFLQVFIETYPLV